MLQIIDTSSVRSLNGQKAAAPLHSPSGAHPMERAWSAGKPALQYIDRPKRVDPRTADVSTMSLDDLIKTQPKVRKGQSPFAPVDTRGREVPSEHAKAFFEGSKVLSLDMPADATFDAGRLISELEDDAPSVGRMTPYTMPDLDSRYRIESEQRSVWSGPLVRSKIVNRRGLDIVVIDSPKPLPADEQKKISLSHLRWLRDLWAPSLHGSIPTAEQIAAAAPRIEAMRSARRQSERPAFGQEYDLDPMRLRFMDEELHAPFEETLVEPDKDEAMRRFGRPLDELLNEEIAELVEHEVSLRKADGRDIPVRRFLRGHRSWGEAVAAKIHFGDYVASEVDILG